MSISIVPSEPDDLPVRPAGEDLRVDQAGDPAAGDRHHAAVADPGRPVILKRPERGRHVERGLEAGYGRGGDHEASGRTNPDS